MKYFGFFFLAGFVWTQTSSAQPQLLDCSCLNTQSVLITNACQAVIPDLCQFTNCYQSTAVPPPTLTCSQNPAAGTPVGPGVYGIVVTVTDPFGTASQCAIKFTVVGPTPGNFTLICATNKTVDCAAQWNFNPPTPTNYCCPPAGTPGNGVTVVVTTTTNGVCPRVYTRTWQATDACGQTATCQQTVTVVDTTPPSINIGQNQVTVTCGQGWGYTVPIVSDNCTPAAQLNVIAFSTTTNLLCGQSYVGTRVWKVTDLCGNSTFATQAVTVLDNIPPVINCGTNKSVTCGTTWTFDPPTAYKSCITGVGSTNVTITVYSTVTNSLCPLVATRTWTATDGCGNSNQCSQVVTVGGTGGTVLNCNALATNSILRTNACRGVIPDLCPIVQAQQACGCQLTCSQTPAPGTPVGPGSYPITITVTDGSGNSTTCTVTFTVIGSTQSRIWNTGMGGPSGNIPLAPGTTDPNWTLVSAPAGGCSGPAQVQDPNNIPAPPWVTNGPNSQWIGPAFNTANCPPGVYLYRLCFYLPCTDGASLAGQWTSDDWGGVYLNGQPTGNTVPSTQFPNNGFDILHPLSITNGFVCGTNCLDFYVTNATIWTGLRVQLTNTFSDCCCGPAQTILSVFSGMNANGPLPLGAPDPQISLTCAPPGTSYTTALVTQPHPLWLANGPSSQWIGVSQILNNEADGVYCYTVNFNIPCPAGVNINANLTGRWSADDTGTIYLNGNPTGNTLPAGWAFTNWQAINISSGFVPGPNTLTFYVTNGGASATGLRLELTGTASCCSCTNFCTVSIACPPDRDFSICGTQGHVIYPPPVATSSCGAPVTVTCTPPSNTLFPLGTNVVTCTASDPMGNSASCSFKYILRPDTTPPTVDCACLQQHVRPVRACAAVIPDLCQFRDCFSDNCTSANNLACSQTPPAGTPVAPGASYVITITVTDAAGNSSQCQVGFTVIAPTDSRVWHTGGTGAQAANFFVIQTPSGPANYPAVPTAVATGAWLPNDANSSWVGFTPNSAQAAPGVYIYRMAFTLPCTSGASIVGRFLSDDTARIWLNGVPTANFSSSFSSWTPVSITSGFVSGLNTLDIYVTNAIIWTGFRAELTNIFNCCCPQALVLKCPKVVTSCYCGTGTGAQVPYTVTAYSQCPSSNVTVGVVCQPPSPGPFPPGTTIVNCTATDSLGNTTTCSFPVTVTQDTTPPVITCPANITLATCSNTVPAYYKATAKDNCSSAVTIACVPPSGSQFPAGTVTVVTCSATDACGNKSTCSFTVKVINNLVWQTLPAGIADCYSLAGSEPASPGPCLLSAYPGGYWKNFDVTTVDRKVGHTWNFPVTWNILAATFDTRARPPSQSCLGGSANDSISMGLTSCGPPGWLWSRYFGSGNSSAGLVSSQWCNGSGCNFNFNFNLAALPPISGPAINLLPHMNSVKRLDVFYQDDTTVDYATLRVQRCAPQAVLGGFDTTLNNAKLAIGPINWCIIPVNPNIPTWTASVSLGGAPAAALPMTYRGQPTKWNLATGTKARTAAGDEILFASLSLHHESNSPKVELSLSQAPPGVTQVQVISLDNGIPLSVETFPADSSVVLATLSDATAFLGTMFTHGEGFFDIARPAGESGNQLCVRFLPEPEALPFTSLEIGADSINALDVDAPQVRSADKANAITASGDALALALDGNVSVSPLVPGTNSTVGLRWRRPQGLGSSGQDFVLYDATNDMTVYVQAVLQAVTAASTNPPRVTFTATATFSDGTSRSVPPVIFTSSPSGFGVSSMLDGAVQPIHRVQVWSNATLIADVPNPGSVECASLPGIYRAVGSPWFVDADICHRFPFYNRETVRIDGVAYQCSELRISLPSLATVGNSLDGLVGVDIDASGADSLSLSQVIAGPVPLRFLPPLRSRVDDGTGQISDQIEIGWDQPWPALEAAPGVTGPWQKVSTDGTAITLPAGNGVPAQFYRLKE